MTIRLNGERKEVNQPLTLSEFLNQYGISTRSVAVAVNLEIIPRSEFMTREIKDRDELEIIQAVGGG